MLTTIAEMGKQRRRHILHQGRLGQHQPPISTSCTQLTHHLQQLLRELYYPHHLHQHQPIYEKKVTCAFS